MKKLFLFLMVCTLAAFAIMLAGCDDAPPPADIQYTVELSSSGEGLENVIFKNGNTVITDSKAKIRQGGSITVEWSVKENHSAVLYYKTGGQVIEEYYISPITITNIYMDSVLELCANEGAKQRVTINDYTNDKADITVTYNGKIITTPTFDAYKGTWFKISAITDDVRTRVVTNGIWSAGYSPMNSNGTEDVYVWENDIEISMYIQHEVRVLQYDTIGYVGANSLFWEVEYNGRVQKYVNIWVLDGESLKITGDLSLGFQLILVGATDDDITGLGVWEPIITEPKIYEARFLMYSVYLNKDWRFNVKIRGEYGREYYVYGDGWPFDVYAGEKITITANSVGNGRYLVVDGATQIAPYIYEAIINEDEFVIDMELFDLDVHKVKFERSDYTAPDKHWPGYIKYEYDDIWDKKTRSTSYQDTISVYHGFSVVMWGVDLLPGYKMVINEGYWETDIPGQMRVLVMEDITIKFEAIDVTHMHPLPKNEILFSTWSLPQTMKLGQWLLRPTIVVTVEGVNFIGELDEFYKAFTYASENEPVGIYNLLIYGANGEDWKAPYVGDFEPLEAGTFVFEWTIILYKNRLADYGIDVAEDLELFYSCTVEVTPP